MMKYKKLKKNFTWHIIKYFLDAMEIIVKQTMFTEINWIQLKKIFSILKQHKNISEYIWLFKKYWFV